MAEGQGQTDPLAVILPTILSAVLTGRQPNSNDLLTAVLTGKPAVTPAQAASVPVPQPTDPLSLLLPILIQRITGAPTAGIPAGGTTVAVTPVASAPTPAPVDPALKQVKDLLEAFKDLLPQQPAKPPGAPPSQNQTQKILDLLKVMLGGAGKLGPVNGALGSTIGNLLDGKKSAIGIIGGVLTAVLQAAGPSLPAALTGLVGAFPLGQVALPIFLAMTAWGALGKMEKWAGASK